MTEFERKLVGFDNYVRNNPNSDLFKINKFHHMEFYTADATNTANRFTWGLGMHQVAKSDLSTGNKHYASYAVQSNEVLFIFTAPFNNSDLEGSKPPHPGFSQPLAHKFIVDHGLAVRAVGISVDDATDAYNKSIANGAIGVLTPQTLVDKVTGLITVISEIKMFDDTVIRWISGTFTGPFLPNYETVNTPDINYGIFRLDHSVSNVPKLFAATDYLQAATGLHEFGEFTAEDIGTLDSGLNSMVLANNNEFVLFPINEPTFGTKRKSQIQTFLEHNNGAGIQHIALLTNDIFKTMRELRQRSLIGGFEFMPKPSIEYYQKIPERIGPNVLTSEQIEELNTLGLLADKDDQGVLLQVFTKPVGDRPTLFLEIIQRIGCDVDEAGQHKEPTGGCGGKSIKSLCYLIQFNLIFPILLGFGKGNFSELFKSIEEFEKQQEEAANANLTK